MRGKSRDVKPEFDVGPGQYNVVAKDFGGDGTKFTMRSKFEEKKTNPTPCVGAYEVGKSFDYTQYTSHGATLKSRHNDG
jgi:hypothetical protein